VAATIELEFPARTEYLSLVRAVVGTVAGHGPPLEPLRVNDLCLAVSEACANAIDAYNDEGRAGAPVRVRLAVDADRIQVEVSDLAGGFDPDAVPADPTAHVSRERGLGLPLMRILTDELQVVSTEDGTAVCMVMLGGRRR
jgi:serine/threonine-protein kinase RsbW